MQSSPPPQQLSLGPVSLEGKTAPRRPPHPRPGGRMLPGERNRSQGGPGCFRPRSRVRELSPARATFRASTGYSWHTATPAAASHPSGSDPSGKRPGKHRCHSPGARSCQLPPLSHGAPRGAAPVPGGRPGKAKRGVGVGGGCRGCGAAGEGALQPDGRLQLILRLRPVREPLSDQPGARTGGFGSAPSPEDEEPLTPGSEEEGTPDPQRCPPPSPARLTALRGLSGSPEPAEAAPALPRADPLPTGMAWAPSRWELPASRIPGRDPVPEPSGYTVPGRTHRGIDAAVASRGQGDPRQRRVLYRRPGRAAGPTPFATRGRPGAAFRTQTRRESSPGTRPPRTDGLGATLRRGGRPGCCGSPLPTAR